MLDIIYLWATAGFFGVMWLLVIGCDIIIGHDDESASTSVTSGEATAASSSRS